MSRNICFVLYSLLVWRTAAQDNVSDAVREGARLLREGKSTVALASFERALVAQPKMVEALIGKGRTLIQLGNGLAALDSCNQAVNQKLAPEPLACRASAYAALGGDIAALGDWQAVLRMDPDSRLVFRERAAFLRKIGRKAEALEDLKRHIGLEKSDANARFELAGWLREQGQEREAIAQLDEVLKLEPGRREAYQQRAEAHIALGQTVEAIADLTKALGDTAADAAGYRVRGQLYGMTGNLKAAWSDLGKASQLAASAEEKAKWKVESNQYLMAWLTAERDDARRVEMLDGVKEDIPELASRLVELRYLSCRRSRQDDKAMKVVEEASARGHATLEMYLFAADRTSQLNGDLRTLVAWCRKGLQVAKPADRDAMRDLYYLQGTAYTKLRQFPEANVALRAAAAYSGPAAWRANLFLLLGYANYQLRQAQEALRFYTEALSIAGPHQQQVAKNIAAVKAEFQLQ